MADKKIWDKFEEWPITPIIDSYNLPGENVEDGWVADDAEEDYDGQEDAEWNDHLARHGALLQKTPLLWRPHWVVPLYWNWRLVFAGTIQVVVRIQCPVGDDIFRHLLILFALKRVGTYH